MKRPFVILSTVLIILCAISCTQYRIIPYPVPDHNTDNLPTGVKPEDYIKEIPEAEFARLGLLKDNFPAGVRVTQSFISEDALAVTASLKTSRAAQYSMVSSIILTDYPYEGNSYSTPENTPVNVTYTAIETEESSKYSISDFTLEAAAIEVTLAGADYAETVAVNGIKGTFPNDASTSDSVVISVDEIGNTIQSVSFVPDTVDIVIEKYEGEYVVGNETISKEESIGMDGSKENPFIIETPSDVSHMKTLFSSNSETYFRVESDMVLDSDWIIAEGNPITISNGQHVIIDFNHHTITYEGIIVTASQRPFRVEEGGTLVIDNGSDDSRSIGGMDVTDANVYGIFDNSGTLIINGGYFHTIGNANGVLIYNRETGVLTINDGSFVCNSYDGTLINIGNATINDGYFYTDSNNSGRFRYCIISGGTSGEALITFNGGEVHGIQGAIGMAGGSCVVNYVEAFAEDNPKLGYSGSKAFYAIYVSGEESVGHLEINDGIFISDNTALWVGNSNQGGDGGLMLDATAVVNGGYFESTSKEYDTQVDYNVGALTIQGGTFKHNKVYYKGSSDPQPSLTLSDCIPDGFTVEETSDGFSVVSQF